MGSRESIPPAPKPPEIFVTTPQQETYDWKRQYVQYDDPFQKSERHVKWFMAFLTPFWMTSLACLFLLSFDFVHVFVVLSIMFINCIYWLRILQGVHTITNSMFFHIVQIVNPSRSGSISSINE
jgi:hypothetical protein